MPLDQWQLIGVCIANNVTTNQTYYHPRLYQWTPQLLYSYTIRQAPLPNDFRTPSDTYVIYRPSVPTISTTTTGLSRTLIISTGRYSHQCTANIARRTKPGHIRTVCVNSRRVAGCIAMVATKRPNVAPAGVHSKMTITLFNALVDPNFAEKSKQLLQHWSKECALHYTHYSAPVSLTIWMDTIEIWHHTRSLTLQIQHTMNIPH